MTMTLGEALSADDSGALDLTDPSITNEGYGKARKELGKNSKKYDRKTLDGALKNAVLKALDIAIDDILGQAWSGWHELRKYADPQKTEVNMVTISDHTIESAHEPSVAVVVRGIEVHSFDFNVSAQLDVEGINLEVQGGMIQAIRLGSLKLGGSVKLHERTLLEKEVAKVAIPGEMRLAKPIPILSGMT